MSMKKVIIRCRQTVYYEKEVSLTNKEYADIIKLSGKCEVRRDTKEFSMIDNNINPDNIYATDGYKDIKIEKVN